MLQKTAQIHIYLFTYVLDRYKSKFNIQIYLKYLNSINLLAKERPVLRNEMLKTVDSDNNDSKMT